MSQPRVAIVLDQQSHSYQPGDLLSGECRIDGTRSLDLRALELSVLWFTLGQGEENLGVHFFKRLAAEEGSMLIVNDPVGFKTVLPPSPLSYDGVLVKIRWCVRARLFPAKEKEIVVEKPIRLGDVSPTHPIQTSSFKP